MLLHCKTAFAFQASSESCLQPMSSVMDCDEPHLEPSSDLTTSLEIALGKKNHCLAQGCVPSPNVWSMWKCKGPAHPLNDGRQLQRSLEATVRSAEAFPEMASWPNCSHTSPLPFLLTQVLSCKHAQRHCCMIIFIRACSRPSLIRKSLTSFSLTYPGFGGRRVSIWK
jgi:hypothetical protein